jgi:uncharacterized protein with FMN-binding domain
MKRAPFVIAGTAVGVAGVLSFHTQPRVSAARQPTSFSSKTSTSGTAPVASAPPKTTTTAPAAPASKTATGVDAPNQYGDVQVRVTVSGTKITRITNVMLPSSDGKSQEISAAAGPELAQQALTAQSAQIDGVSGASYTSDSYRTSLQSALDQAGFKG